MENKSKVDVVARASAPAPRVRKKDTIKHYADVRDEFGKVHRVLQRKLPFLIPNGRKHMLRLRRERQLAAGKEHSAS